MVGEFLLQHPGLEARSGDGGATWADSHVKKWKPCRARCVLPSAISAATMTKRQLPRATTGKFFT